MAAYMYQQLGSFSTEGLSRTIYRISCEVVDFGHAFGVEKIESDLSSVDLTAAKYILSVFNLMRQLISI